MPSGNNEYGSKAVLPRDRFTIHILYSFFTEKPRPSGRGFFVSILIHPQLALLCRRDYFCRPDSSPACFFVPQGLFPPPGFIPDLLFCAAGMISSARIHLYLALFFRRDYFRRPDSSPTCFFVPQGLFPPPGFILILLFSTTGIISSARIHPQLALFHHRDYCDRPGSSPACSFVLQGLFLLLRCISILLFFSTGIIATARIHPQLAFLCRRDYFGRPDSSLSCSFSPQGLLRPPGFIPSLLFSPQGLLRPPGFILILLLCAAGITSSARIHPYLALFFRRDYF